MICPTKRHRTPYNHFDIQHYSQITNCSKFAPTGMNAAAYLTNQGWRGDGHALHHSGRGITKPIHIPQKANVLGIGKKKHDAHADQWWARAFDDTLKGLNAPKNAATGKTEGVALGSDDPALQMVGTGGPKWVGQGSLYSNFVRGESLSGTLTPEKDQLETKSQVGDESACTMGSNDGNTISATAKDVVKSKIKRRQQVEVIAQYSNLGPFAAVKNKARDIRMEESKQNVREILKGTETNEQRRQRVRGKKARRALEAAESRTLPGQPRKFASKNGLTSDRLAKRSKDHPHTAEDTQAVATGLRKASRDGTRKCGSGKE